MNDQRELATGLVFLGYMVGVFGLAILSNRLLQKKSFLAEYFLGSRGLGVWTFTFAATGEDHQLLDDRHQRSACHPDGPAPPSSCKTSS